MNIRKEECTLLFLRKSNRILLVIKKQGFGISKWNGIGGTLSPEESVEHALVRECEEQIGVILTTRHEVAVINFAYPNGNQPVRQKVHVFIGDEWEGEPEETEGMAPRWFQIGEIPYDHMWEDDALWLPLILRGQKLQCGFGFNGNADLLSASINIIKEPDQKATGE